SKDVSHGQVRIGSYDRPDFISGTQFTLGDYSKIRARPLGFREAARELVVVHSNSKPPAGNPRLGNLEQGSPDRPSLTNERGVHIDPLRREVLAELTVRK